MPPFALEHSLCLNDMAVPLFRRTADFEDVKNIAGGCRDDAEFLCLDLKATANARWLEIGLGMAVRSWVKRQASVDIMKEIREAINGGKIRKGDASRLPKRPNSIVPLEIRKRTILAKNQTNGITLAFNPGEEKDAIQWFLEELEKDLDIEPIEKKQQQEDLEGADPTPKRGRSSRDDVHDIEGLEKTLRDIRAHRRCRLATFLPSRSAIRVVAKGLKGNVGKELPIKNFKKIMKSGVDEKLQTALEVTKHTALEHLKKMQETSCSSSSKRSGPSSDDAA